MLSLDGLVARYGRITALHGVSMQVAAGQVVCLLGANGAGKTTVLNCISGMIPGWSGDIRFEGASLAGLSPDRIVAAGIVQVPEGRVVFRSMSVRENLELGAWLNRFFWSARLAPARPISQRACASPPAASGAGSGSRWRPG